MVLTIFIIATVLAVFYWFHSMVSSSNSGELAYLGFASLSIISAWSLWLWVGISLLVLYVVLLIIYIVVDVW